MIQVLDLGGLPLLLFIIYLANGYALDVITGLLRKQKPLAPAVAFILLLSVIAVYGKFRLDEHHDKKAEGGPEQSIRVVSIQPNIPLVSYLRKGSIHLQPMIKLSRQAIKKFPAGDVFVLPEIPNNLDCGDDFYRENLGGLAIKSGKEFLVQCDKTLGRSPTYYFSAAKNLSPLPANDMGRFDQEYHKIILFPFGEYLPWTREYPFLLRIATDFGRNFTAGQKFTVFDLDENKTAATPICYEAVFSNHIREFIHSGANIIINMTNDAWWGKSDLSIVHFALTSFRAVEYRVPMVRVTNSGVGAFVEATGEIVAGSMTPYFEEAITSFPLFIPEQRSPYFYPGDAFLWILLVLFAADLLRSVKILRRQNAPLP